MDWGYFLNHLIYQNIVNGHNSIHGIIFLFSPLIFSFFIIFVMAKIFRGTKFNLFICAISAFIFFPILPAILGIHSLLYVGQSQYISLYILLLSFFTSFQVIALEEYYPRYRYKTDDVYIKSHPLPKNTIANYPFPKRLQISNILYFSSFIFIFTFAVIYKTTDEHVFLHNIALIGTLIGGYGFILFLAIVRWWLRCPSCHRTIYGFESKDNKAYFLSVMYRIFKYHCFTCMYCKAFVKVGNRDILAEKGLEIDDPHRIDFVVKKIKK